MFLFSITWFLGPTLSSFLAQTNFHQRLGHGNMTGSQEVGWQRMLVWCTDIAGALQCSHPGSTTWRALCCEKKNYKISFFFFVNFQSPLLWKCVECFQFLNGCHFLCFGGWPLGYSTLQEADGAYIHSKFLICSSDVHWSNVYDWQTGGFLCFVLEDSLAPPAWVTLLDDRRDFSIKIHTDTTASNVVLHPPCNHPPAHCMWIDCCPLRGSPHHWSPAVAMPS